MECLVIDAAHSSTSEELGKYMQVDAHILPSQQELAKLIPDYSMLTMRIDPAINRKILDAAKNLKVIGVCSVDLNYVDLETTKAKGIQVFNAPGSDANTVAGLTLSKMLDIARHTIPIGANVKINKNWGKYKLVGSELRDKTLSILGFGRIDRRVSELGRAFLMNVAAYDPSPKLEDLEKESVKGVDVDELLKISGHISIHIPLTPGTKSLFNAESIARMKSNAAVLNMDRGGIASEQDMYEALKANRIGSYATDMTEDELAAGGLGEGASFDSPLFEYDNFIVTPHLGAQSLDAPCDTGVSITTKLKEALSLN